MILFFFIFFFLHLNKIEFFRFSFSSAKRCLFVLLSFFGALLPARLH